MGESTLSRATSGIHAPLVTQSSTSSGASRPSTPPPKTKMETLITFSIIIFWYISNIGLLLLNKLLLSNFGFSLMSYAAVLCGMVKMQRIQSRKQLLKVATVALVFCGSLVLANTSLRYIPVSFNQAIGSTTPAFTAFFSIIMTRKYETRPVYLALVPVVLGICIASGFEPSFHAMGFACCLLATAARAFKSVLQGILLFDQSEKLDSMNLLMYMSPIASLALVPMTYVFERDAVDVTVVKAVASSGFLMLLILNAFLAYFVNLTNFLVTRHTSALTLQVLGNAKGVIAAGVSVLLFKNQLTSLGVLGYGVTVSGVFAYSEAKRRQKVASLHKITKVQDVTDKVPLLMEAGELIKADLMKASPHSNLSKSPSPKTASA